MKTFMIGAVLICVAMLVGVVACTDPEAIALARMRELDAAARLEAAPVLVIEAQTNATLQKLSWMSKLSKEERTFDAQMARQEFTTIILEFQALSLAIRQDTEAALLAAERLEKVAEQAEPIGHNAAAAAANSWWGNLILAGLSFGLIGLAILMMYSFNKLNNPGSE